MNTGGSHLKLIHGSRIQKITTGFKVLKKWLSHPEMKRSHKLAKRPKIIQYIDFLFSVAFYGATLQDYLVFEFYNKSHKKRKSFVTGRKLHQFFDKVNNKNRTDIFREKNRFAEVFKTYLGREIFMLNLDGSNIDDAKSWLSDRSMVFAKPRKGVEGRGVTRLAIDDNIEDIINYCLDNKLDLIEESIVQHPEMNELHPHSANTIRLITLVENKDVRLVGASLRMGNGGHVDNAAQGGIYASVDSTTGKLDSVAFNSLGEKYANHPITNQPIKGFQIPFWENVVEICKKAALEVPDVRCVGWDVAISEKGPLLIEGNDRWSRFVWQHPKERGLYNKIKDY